jgi:hypothetical protein
MPVLLNQAQAGALAYLIDDAHPKRPLALRMDGARVLATFNLDDHYLIDTDGDIQGGVVGP